MQKVIDGFLKLAEQNFATEIFAFLLGAVLVGAYSFIARRLRLARDQKRLELGMDTDRVFCQLNLLEPQPDGRFALRLFNLPGSSTVQQLYRTNEATALYVRKLVNKTTLAEPILNFEGQRGKNALHEIFNHFACILGSLSHEMRVWLFIATCEDGDYVERKRIRCFLISEADLERFEEWDFAKSVFVFNPIHSFRLIALHKIAVQRREKRSGGEMIGPMVAAVPVKFPLHKEPVAVDWSKEEERKALADTGLAPAEKKPAPAPKARQAEKE